jgi:hypothetical protein
VAVTNVADALGIEFGVTVRGYADQEGSPSTVRLRAAPMFSVGGFSLCPLLEGREHRRSVYKEHQVLNGDVKEQAVLGGAVLGGSLPSAFGARLGWQTETALMFRDWDLNGRRTIVDDVADSVYVEALHWVRQSWHVLVSGGVNARWSGIGLVAGIGTRPMVGRNLYGFLTLGFRLGA